MYFSNFFFLIIYLIIIYIFLMEDGLPESVGKIIFLGNKETP
jgi:hypothetical protein